MTSPNTTGTSLTSSPAVSIVADKLGKRFNREWIFKSLDLSFTPGHTYAITGPNGSGKSTLLQVLWGQMPPSVGTLRYADGNNAIGVEDFYKHIAIATPYMDLIDEFTLTEQLNFHFRMKKSRKGMSIDEMIDRMYLGQARHKYISNFSSGMRQRVKLSLAFFTEASVIFLDEPGTNLDHQAFEWYLRELKSLPAEATLFIASNEPDEYPDSAIKIDIMHYK